MKKLFLGTFVFVFFSVFFLVSYSPVAGADKGSQDVPVVKKLRKMVEADAKFRELLDLTFKNVQKTPEGDANPWQGKTIDDLCAFFNEWYYFLPTTTNGLTYIRGFQIIYYRNQYGLQLVKTEPLKSWLKEFSIARGEYMDSAESVKGIADWLNAPGINMHEYYVPEGGFKSFNEFFTRNIKPEMRPVNAPDDDTVIVAPADCLIEILPYKLETDTQVPVKGSLTLDARELLDGSGLADRFVGGTVVRCILEPTFYHHYHAPVSGLMVESNENVPGLYYDSREDMSVFERFHRGYYIFKTEKYGYVAMVPVGLATISSVVFDDPFKRVKPEAPVRVKKGTRLGHFAYGGSMILLLFEPQRYTSVKTAQGQRIGIFE